MTRPLFLLLAAGLACGAAACTPSTSAGDSPAGSDAAAADTAGAHASLQMDRAGVRMDSAGTKPVK
jgi:hypothetical protein